MVIVSVDQGVAIANEAKKWADARVPYRHRGVTMEGCDCSGLVIGVMKKLGFLLNYKLRYYPIDWNLHNASGEYLVQELRRYAIEVKKSEIRLGDVLVFKFGRCESHAAILVDKNVFVHCYLSAKHCWYGVLKGSSWMKRWTKVFRWKNNL